MIPTEVLEKAQRELLNWNGMGCSIMELSHRSPEFSEVLANSEASLRRLLNIPEHYKVLFMHGSASHQFAMVPMNFLGKGDTANYLELGLWSQKAIKEAKRFSDIHVQKAVSEDAGLLSLVPESKWQLKSDAKYLHFTSNETILGLQFQQEPKSFRGKLVCDMCSDILSKPIDIENYALIYAGAQKNIGPSGMTIVIVREDLFEQFQSKKVPSLFRYPVVSEHNSMFNTPPTFGIYLAGLVFDWLESKGGLVEMEKENQRKAQLLYDCIEQSDFYHSPIAENSRSVMNVAFNFDEALYSRFLSGAKSEKLIALKGHRSFGGMRASLYNAMPYEGVKTLAAYMKEFERTA